MNHHPIRLPSIRLPSIRLPSLSAAANVALLGILGGLTAVWLSLWNY